MFPFMFVVCALVNLFQSSSLGLVGLMVLLDLWLYNFAVVWNESTHLFIKKKNFRYFCMLLSDNKYWHRVGSLVTHSFKETDRLITKQKAKLSWDSFHLIWNWEDPILALLQVLLTAYTTSPLYTRSAVHGSQILKYKPLLLCDIYFHKM
jgi:hypothetical protein